MDTAEGTSPPTYDGFISYSHAADDLLAPRLQSALQRFAKPWWKRRAVRIFRDESSLSANPHLWSSITEALDTSGWFVLLLSPDAAQSEWVNQEIAYWVTNKDPSRILPVVTDGEFGWADGDIDSSSTAAPPALSRVFSEEPRWVDLRWARTEEQLDLSNARFRDGIADIASALRQVPKDELESEEVRQHRRTIRTAWFAGIIVLLLGVAAVLGAVVAVGQSNEAQDQKDEAERQADIAKQNEQRALDAEAEARDQAGIVEDERNVAEEERDRADAQAVIARANEVTARAEALAAHSIAVIGDDPELSVLLAAQALSLEPRLAAVNSMHSGLQAHRTIFQAAARDSGIGSVVGGLSPDGRRIAIVGSFTGELTVWDVDTQEELWSLSTTAEGWPIITAGFTQDGQYVVAYGTQLPALVEFEFRVFDANTGEFVRVIEVPDCSGWKFWPGVRLPYFDLSQPMVWARDLDCDHLETIEGEVGLLDPGTGLFNPIREITAGPVNVVGVPTRDSGGTRIAIDDAEGVGGLVIDVATGTVIHEFPSGIATLSSDGKRLLWGGDANNPLELTDLETGLTLWRFSAEGDIFTRAWFSVDESLVYATNFDGSTYVIEADTGFEALRLRGHTGFQREVVMSADNTRLATFSADGTARVWDIGSVYLSEGPTYVPFGPLPGDRLHHWPNVEIAGGVATVWAGTPVRLDNAAWEIVNLDLDSGEALFRVDGGAPALSPDGSLLAYRVVEPVTLSADVLRGRADPGEHRRIGDIRLIESRSGEFVASIVTPCHTYLAGGVSIPGDGCEGKDRQPDWTRIWDLEFSADGSMLGVVDGGDRAVRVYDVDSGELLWSERFPGEFGISTAEGVDFSPDGTHFAVHFIGGGAVIRIYEADDFTLVAELPAQQGLDLAFVSDGSLLVAGDATGALRYIETTGWTEVASVGAHNAGAIARISSNPSSTLVSSTSSDGVRVWDLNDRSLHTEITIDDARSAVFVDDTHLLVIPQFDSIAIIVSLDPVELVSIAAWRVTRGFTETECATYGIDPCPTTLEALRGG